MGRITKVIEGYIVNQVDYPRNDGHIDIVCQVKKNGVEICHCTWHPDGVIHCKGRNNSNFDYLKCPLFGDIDCLR